MSDMKLVRGIGFSFGMTAGVVTILLESFPILYENATDREASVESLLMRQQRRGGGGVRRSWDVRFHCDFNIRGMELVAAFIHL